MALSITTRARWNARPPRDPSNVSKVQWQDRTEFVVHHTEGPTTQTPRAIQDFHIDERGWNDIGYNFLVKDDGTIYEGRGWLVVGAHAPNHNRKGIGVAYIGRDNPSEAAKRSIRMLYDHACEQAGRSLAKKGHRQVTSTDCPGSKLQGWVDNGMPMPARETVPRSNHRR